MGVAERPAGMGFCTARRHGARAAPPAASAPAATAPAAAPAATAPPSSEAQQLADMKAMFEQGLIPSREIYEDKVRQILGLR